MCFAAISLHTGNIAAQLAHFLAVDFMHQRRHHGISRSPVNDDGCNWVLVEAGAVNQDLRPVLRISNVGRQQRGELIAVFIGPAVGSAWTHLLAMMTSMN